jgi:zinc protease
MARAWCVALLLWLAAALNAGAAPWSAVTSDLPADPAVRWGSLPNGLRYAILPNPVPKGRVSLRLLVSAGSLHERDDERGLAHFIEHMAFRSTKAYPRGSLVPSLEHSGIALGPDNTAFTTYNYTIYHLELPNALEPTLRLGLGVFREYADGITFDPDLIILERGVILSEKATRNTPELRIGQANQALLWPAMRELQRAPIGTEEMVRNFTRDRFVGFYNAWYRPERMAVIVTGDVSPDSAVRLIADIFGSLQPRAPAREEPADLVTREASPPNVAVVRDPGWTGVTLTFEHPFTLPDGNDTHERRVAALHRELAFAMFQKRLEHATHEAVGNYVAPAAAVTSSQPPWLLSSITVSGNSNNWRPLAAEIEQQHRRAFVHGFIGEELRVAKAQFAAAYENAVRTADTRASPFLAEQLAGVMLYGGTFATPAALQADLAGDLADATTDECLAAFREAWSASAPHVFLAVNPQALIARTDVADVLNQSRNVEVHPPEEKAPVTFAYTDFGPAGALAHSEHLDDLDIQLARFDNGVRLNFKPTTYEAGNIDLCVRVGSGRLVQPRGFSGIDLFANSALMSGGLHRHTVEDLNALFAGRNFNVTFNVVDDAFIFSARCAPRDLLLCLQVIAAYLTDAAYDPGMIRDVRASLASIYTSLANTPGGPIQAKAEFVVTGGDRRFGLPDENDLMSRDFAELHQWLEPQFQHGPIELGVVGDVKWDEVLAAASRTLGALPARDAPAAPGPGDRVQFAKLRNALAFTTSSALTQSSLAFYWPAPDVADTHQERRCTLLAAVLAERVRERLREELGATYTPSADFVRRDAFPGLSYFAIAADVSPAVANQAAQIVAQEIAKLRTKGVDEDTFVRVRQPLLRAREDDVRTNAYWLYTVISDAQQHPARIAAARDRLADYSAVTRAEIDALLKRYFTPDNVFLFSTHPSTGAVGQLAVGPPLKQAAPLAGLGAPRPIRQNKANYPAALRAKGITGVVTVEFVVGADGRVVSAKAIKSPDPAFSKAAEEAVLSWEFVPGVKDGKKVSVLMRVDVTFDLNAKK